MNPIAWLRTYRDRRTASYWRNKTADSDMWAQRRNLRAQFDTEVERLDRIKWKCGE